MRPPAASPPTARKNMWLLIQLRWIAVAGQIVAIAFAAWFLRVQLPLVPMSAVVACLVLLNALSSACHWGWLVQRHRRKM